MQCGMSDLMWPKRASRSGARPAWWVWADGRRPKLSEVGIGSVFLVHISNTAVGNVSPARTEEVSAGFALMRRSMGWAGKRRPHFTAAPTFPQVAGLAPVRKIICNARR